MFNVVGVSTGIAVGALADWLGHRRVILFGLVCLAAGSLAGAFSDGAAVILFSRFIEGLGAIVVFVATPGLILRAIDPADTRLAFGVWSSYMPAGAATMVLLTPVLLGPLGWRGIWVVNAALLLAFALVFTLGTRDFTTAPGAGRKNLGAVLAGLGRDIRSIFATPGPLLLGLCFATYTGNFLAVFGFLPTFLIEARDFGSGAAAALTALAIAVNVLGNLVGGWLLHHGAARARLMIVASIVMAIASFGIYAAAMPDELRYLLCLVFSGVGGILPASVLGAAPVHAPRPELIATTNGLIVQGANIGQLAVPPALAALVAATGGWQASPFLITGLAVLGAVLAFWVGAIERRLA